MEDTNKPRRYFWFHYEFVFTDGRRGTGEDTLSSIGHFNKLALREYLKTDMAKRFNMNPSDVSIVLVNFKELNEEDYKDFTYKGESDES